MIIGTCTVTLQADWVSSLKGKRMIVKSLIDRVRHKFNVSAAEVDDQDVHKLIVIGFACVTNEVRHANSIIDNVLDFIENNTEAQIVDTVIEIL
ncbi:MAG: DUF503 domain-containing protein [Clostridia bacterium]|jgi:uncharacterized protein YlxP (DUF503 family)|nr:DUF503 domain-containing protein [Clostridia bacterium]MCI1960093.1 DUF503 domain-containing protein [Clostridia bacterium]MCI2000818.1 DUF503 domain-containing protein [Clostridia bacterium]MCI2015390.1 DUF503 domain-containing protein [Clostridia bacterium]